MRFMFKIGNITIKNNVGLAPMAGVSNPAYMKICEEMGVGWVVTELISSEAIVRGNKKTLEMLKGIEDLNIVVGVQIFGSCPFSMAKAAKIISKLDNVAFIDINMGCPVPKVALKGKAGSALLKDVYKIREIVEAVSLAVSCPVTVKIRSGWDSNSINACLVSKVCEEAGAKAICIHGRTRALGYSGTVDLEIIKKVKETVNIPVIGNGDIKTIDDAKNMLDYTGCDAVMIGRGALGNPWFLKECVSYLEKGEVISKPTLLERVEVIKKHYNLLKKYNGLKKALLEIRSHALWYIKGIPGVKKYKTDITNCKSEEEFFKVLEEIKTELGC